jgi:hypothetical protein
VKSLLFLLDFMGMERKSSVPWYRGEFPLPNTPYPLLPRTKLNVVVQVKPWLYLKTLSDCWYIIYTIWPY